ncbi:methyltransferase, FkbM family [Flavobacteriaceae bacterium MAR_2010_188]|nr:methyltransferase, FkbM family [Flavobacteriaceae bacterium MAR_2010_188]
MVKFLFRPTTRQIASKYIERIEKNSFYEVRFKNLPNTLFWPLEFDINSVYQVTSETFDSEDWHYYRKNHTDVENGEILLDIGTAEGLFPLAIINTCEKIFLVEPSQSFCEALATTFKPFEEKVVIHNTAVGDEDGVINFSEDALMGRIGEHQGSINHMINLRKIDSIIPENQKITYIKADIEGYEYEMLKGAKQTIKKNKPKIAITAYHKENIAKEMIDLILTYVPEYNYYVKGIFEQGPKPVMIHFWID